MSSGAPTKGNLGPEFTPWALSANPHNGGLYVGSSHGTWKLPPPEPVTVGRSQPSIRTSFGLHQNHPNPFNPSTAITYQLPEATGVTLKVYNIYGQQVRTLVDKRMSSGVQSVRWDGTNESGEALSSGLYIYVIETEHGREGRKMLLVR